ncbi:unnamed protein product, partial [marine sediment metagenome]
MKVEATAPRKGDIHEQVQRLVLKADTDDEMIMLASIAILVRDKMLDEFLGLSIAVTLRERKRKEE